MNEADNQVAELQNKTTNTIKELTSEIEILNFELTQTKNKLDNEKNARIQIERVTTHAEEERKYLKEKLIELNNQKNELTYNYQLLYEELEINKKKLSDSIALINKYENKPDYTEAYKNLESKAQQMQITIDNLQQHTNILNQNENSYREHIFMLEKELENSQYQKSQSDSNKLMLQNKFEELQNEVKQKSREISFLTSQLNSYKQNAFNSPQIPINYNSSPTHFPPINTKKYTPPLSINTRLFNANSEPKHQYQYNDVDYDDDEYINESPSKLKSPTKLKSPKKLKSPTKLRSPRKLLKK